MRPGRHDVAQIWRGRELSNGEPNRHSTLGGSMQKKRPKENEPTDTPKLLRDLLIAQLALAGVGQKEIRAVVGGNMSYINRIVKLVRKKANTPQKKGK